MFKKSAKKTQLDAFASVPTLLESSSYKQYSDESHWHNQFRKEVVMRIDESMFSVLFNNTTGAPNAPIHILVGMMILKEAFGWSDSQLFEHCRFNLLVRSSLGLFNINDALPVESTYYLLRKRIYDYQKQSGDDLMGKAFASITSGQVKDFEVNGSSIRMDSKLFGSNIAMYPRFEIIHTTLRIFYESLDGFALSRLKESDKELLKQLIQEEASKIVFRSSKEEIKSRLQSIGLLIYNMLSLYDGFKTDQLQLLQRVFTEQYKVCEDQQIELRPKEEISSSSVQSPHDTDCSYRDKGGQHVKGYSVNITETCSPENLNLITNVIVDKANISDTLFVEPAITATKEVTGQKVEKVYADGAFQSPDNDEFCKDIDMVFTGIQGAEPRYDIEMKPDGLWVTDTNTGEQLKARLVKKRKGKTEDKWSIKTSTCYLYFDQKAIRASEVRRKMRERPLEELHKRNNVEATIFQLSIPLRNGKSKYRGLVKQKIWAYCRCLWINFVRILNLLKQICQRTLKVMALLIADTASKEYLDLKIKNQPPWSCILQTLTLFFIFAISYPY